MRRNSLGPMFAGLRTYWLAGLIILVPVLLVFSKPDAFPYPPHPGSYSDLAITHYPNAIFLRQELLTHRAVPLWSPAILSGYPFFANPLSGLMYPPGWLALMFPLPAGFNLLAALHLIFGAFGMAALLRAEGAGLQPSLLGGLVFAMFPKVIAHYGAGHLTLIYAISWTPWLLWASIQEGSGTSGRWRWILPGAVLALIIVADVRWGVYAEIAWWLYDISHSHSKKKAIGSLLLQSLLAILLVAPLILPLLEYAMRSTRTLMTPADILVYSLPPARLLTIMFPDFGGFHEWILYPGGAVLCLSTLAIAWIRASASVRFWLGLALFSLLVALGEFIPGARLIAQLPGVSLLRVPSRSLFLFAISLAALTGCALEEISKGYFKSQLRIARLILTGLIGYVLIFSLGMALISKQLPSNFVWGAVAVLLAAVWTLFSLSQRGQHLRGISLAGFSFLILIDLFGVDRSLISFRSQAEVFRPGSAAAAWISGQSGLFRIYSPSYSLPLQTAARYGLQLADGVDPLQLEAYTKFMANASGVDRPGYSVTLPSFGDESPAIANADMQPDVKSLGLLNIRYVVSEFEISAPELQFREAFGNTRIYENTEYLPRAWVQPADQPLGQQAVAAQVIDWRPDRIEVFARGPGILVLSEIAYPGWRASVDGRPVKIEDAGEIFRAVSLDAGDHQIILRLRPLSLYTGLALALIGLGIYFGILRFQVVSEHRA